MASHQTSDGCCALLQVFTGATIVSPLLISILWCLYNMIPPVLVFTYAIGGRKYSLGLFSLLCMVLSVAVVVGSLALVWWIQARCHHVHPLCSPCPANSMHVYRFHLVPWRRALLFSCHLKLQRRLLSRLNCSWKQNRPCGLGAALQQK